MIKYKNKNPFLYILMLIIFVLSFGLGACGSNEAEADLDLKIDTEAKAIEPKNVVAKLNKDIPKMIEENHDTYATYFTPEEYKQMLDQVVGSYSGIGIYVVQDPDTKKITVVMPMHERPAEEAGILPEDEIYMVNGEDITGMDIDYVVSIMKGEPGTKVNVGIKRDGEELSFEVKRAKIEVRTIDKELLKDQDGIGYIAIDSFNTQTGEEFTNALKDLKDEYNKELGNKNGKEDLKGIIVDLRYNGGGELNAALSVADHFVPDGQVILWELGKDETKAYKSEGEPLGIPLVILQNEGSASASEVLAGAIKDNNVGELVGTKSYGKGIMQSITDIQETNAGIRVTTAKFMTASKAEIQDVGIEPNYVVEMPENIDPMVVYSKDADKDPQFAKALKVLNNKIKAGE